MSFSFGAKTGFGTTQTFGAAATPTQNTFGAAAQPAQPGLFGAATCQPSTALSFGLPASSTPATGLFGSNPAPSGGLNFGAPTNVVAPSFGAPTAAPTFGTQAPTAAPTFGAPNPTAASMFGATTSTAPTFGGVATVAPTFGAPIASVAPTFAATASALPTFGATAAAAPPFGAAASVAPTFGAAVSTAPQFGANTGLSFGTPTSVSNANTGLSFGTTQTPGFSLGTPKTGLSFGTPTASTGLTLGTPASTAPAFSLGGPTSTLGGGIGLSTSTAPPLNFGSTPGTGLNFGLGTNTATTSSGLAFGFSTPCTTTTQAAPIGLGGVANSTPSQNSATAKTEQAPKDQNLPNEIQQTVDNFKNFVKQQKTFSSDVARCSIKEFKQVESDIDAVSTLLNDVEKQLHMNKITAEKLKYDTARGLQQVEIAQRTYDTPLGLQYENNAPLQFFMELVDNFEREMQNMKLQIENTDKYFKNIGNCTPLSSQELAMGMRRIHETFVALAGRLQSVHTQVEAQKEQYLNFRRHMLNDATDVFEKTNKEADVLNFAICNYNIQPPKVATGPTPFNSIGHPSVIQAAAQSNPPPAYQPSNAFAGFPASLNLGGGNNTGLLFGSNTFGQPNQSSFQLQKPPSGNKRGKQ